ncbi:MAG: putative type secretion system protein precursor [Verrucomicrobiota bacterium]
MNIHRSLRATLFLGLALGLSATDPFARVRAADPVPAAPAPATAGTNAPTAAAVPAPAIARNIRFQFEGIPYADVIERFAQMSGKPVVGEVNIPGTITFNDSNAYNYAEAFDTLNVILSMKGQMIVEEGNFLRVLPFKELPQTPLRILRGGDKADGVRPGEVVTVVLDLKNLDAKEISESITNLLSSAGSVAPLSRGRGLILTDRLVNIQRVKALIGSVDNETAAQRQMKTYTLLHASGAVVADLVNRTFGVTTAPKRTQYNPNSKQLDVLPADPNDYVTAVYDDASRTLVLFGPRERLALADELITRFEDGGSGAGDVRIYTPEVIKAEELANMIRQAIPGVAAPNETGSAAATKARVIAEKNTNRLIVAAPLAGMADQIEALVNRLDKPVHGSGRTAANGTPGKAQVVQVTRVFRTRTSEVKNVGKILTEALTKTLPNGQKVPTASVSVEPGSQSIVVTGSPGDVQTATDIISQLETGSTNPKPQQTRFIDLGSVAEAKRIVPLVEQIYRSEVADGSAGGAAHAKIMAEPNTSRLIVTASEEHLTRIEEIVRNLRAEKSKPLQRALHILALRNARLETAFPSINSLINERMSDRRFEDQPKPSVVPDNANNRLLVTATEEQKKEIEAILAVVDVAPERQKRQMAVIPVNGKSPAELITLAGQMMSQLGEQPSNPQLEPKLIPDASGKQIIVLATDSDIQRVRTLIQQLDATTTSAVSRQFRNVELHNRNAAELTPLVQQLYQEQIKGNTEPPGGPATLMTDAKNNRIMVSGAEREITRVEAIIRQLDPAGQKSAKEETRIIRLKTAVASEISSLVEKSLGSQTQSVKVLVDTRSNSLVITGEPAAVEAASKIIRELDIPSEVQPREMKVIELKQADAAALATLATTLATDLLKSQRGAEYTPKGRIMPDPAANRVIISAPREEITLISQVVERLDQAPEAAGGARVFRLNNADAAQVVSVVSNAMVKFDARNQPIRRASVSLDRESNSIVVSGSRQDLKDAEGIIQRLDNEGVEGSGGTGGGSKSRNLKMVEVVGEPDTLAQLATRVFLAQNAGRSVTNLVSITPEPNGRRLIVLAPDSLMAQVETVISALDARPDQSQRQLHTIEPQGSRAADLLPMVNKIYAEQNQGRTTKPATLYTDPTGDRLMVFGTADQATAVRQIVTTLATEMPEARTNRVFEIGKPAEAQRLLPIVQQLYKDQASSRPSDGPADTQLLTEPRSGRIIASGRISHLDRISEIIANLKATGSAGLGRETRTFEVGSASDVQRVQPLLQQLYTDQWKERSDTDPADAQILGDPRSGRIIVTGRPDHLQKIESILQQLGTGPAKPGADSREVRIIDLATATASELATTVRGLYLDQAKARFGGTAPDTTISSDTGSNRLIVVGETNELAVIEDLVRKLDKVGSQSATARVFKIKSAEPDKVAEVLSTALVRYDAFGRAQKRATVSVDAKSRTLIVTGDPKELQAVSTIIEQLDTSLGARPDRRMKVVTLRQGKVGELSARVRQLYNDQSRNQPELALSDLLILDDATSNQLILAGSEAQLALVDGILGELQKNTATRAPRETRPITVGQPDEVVRVLPLLRQLYTERWKTQDAADPADAVFTPDAPNGRILVTARTNHLAEIESLLGVIQAPTATPAPRETRVLNLAERQASELAETVRSLYEESLKAKPVSPSEQAVIRADTEGNRLIVTGRTNDLEQIAALVLNLDTANQRSGNSRIFRLTNAEPAQVAAALSNTLAKVDPSGRITPRVTLGIDNTARTLVVSGQARDLQAAEQIVTQLDATTQREARDLQVLPILQGSATEAVARLRPLVLDRLKASGKAADLVLIPDDSQSRVLVTANATQWQAVQEIASRLLTTGTNAARGVRTVALRHVTAAPVITLLGQLFSREMDDDAAQRLVVTPALDERSLLVNAPPALFDRVQSVIQSVDVSDPGGSSVLQTVLLRKTVAETVAESVNKAIAGKGTDAKLRRVSITPVTGANALLLNGPGEAVQEVLKLVKELDAESATGEVEVRIYKLGSANAADIQPVLSQLLANVSTRLERRGFGSRAQPTIAIDPRSNSLLITASATHFKLIEQLLPTLDKAPDRSDRDVQFVWLQNARAADIRMKVAAVYEERPRGEQPVLEVDREANTLTVIARRSDMPQIQDLIQRLDASAQDNSLQVRLLTVDDVPVEQMVGMLTNIYPQMYGGSLKLVDRLPVLDRTKTNHPAASPEVTVALDRNANALILSGPAPELDRINRMVVDLSWKASSGESDLRILALAQADPVVLARTLNNVFRPGGGRGGQPEQQQNPQNQRPPRFTVVPESRSRSLLVRASAKDFSIIEALVKQLDTANPAADLSHRLITLTHTPPSKITPLVQQLVQQLSAQHPGDPLTVLPYGRSKGLLVVAREPLIAQVEKMIKTLDTPSEDAEAEVRVFTLKQSAAPAMATTLQNLLRPGAAGEAGSEARELQEQVRKLNIRGDSGDPVALDLQRPIKITADPSDGNRLLITSTPKNLEALGKVVEMLDQIGSAEAADFAVVALLHADARTTGQTLTAIFTQGARLGTRQDGPGKPEAGSARALASPLNVTPDSRLNALILSGRKDSIELARKLIKDLDKQWDAAITEVKVFRVKYATPSRLLPMLQSVFAEGPAVPGTEGLNNYVSRLQTRREGGKAVSTEQAKTRTALTLQADDNAGALIVAARADTLPLIEELLTQLDIPDASGLSTVRIYPLKHADASAVQKIITDLHSGPRNANAKPSDRPTVTLDDRSNSMIVSGNEKAFAIIDNLIAQLDKPMAPEFRDVRILPLAHADAAQLAGTLQRLMDQRVARQGSLGKGQADSLKVLVLPEPRSNSLLVGGGKDAYELVESLARKLDDAAPGLTGGVRIVPLEYADARILAASFNQLFTQRYQASTSPELQRQKPVILPDARVNALMVSAGREDNETIDALLKKLDRKLDNPSLALTVLPLKHNDAARVAATLEGVFAARIQARTLPGQTPSPTDRVEIQTDSLNNSLIVSSNKENLDLIKDLLTRIDVEPTVAEGVLETFVLKHADAQRVSTMLKSLVQQGMYRPGRSDVKIPGQASRDAMAIAVDTRSNTLMVSASPDNLGLIKEILAKVDTVDFVAATDLKVYKLEHARASNMAGVLTQYLQARKAADAAALNAPERSMPVAVIADTRLNAILATGSKEAIDMLDRIVPQLDAEDRLAQLNFRVFPLKEATATRMQTTLQRLFANRPPKARGEPVDPITVVADAWVNALIVGAVVEDMSMIDGLIQRLDTQQAELGLKVEVIPLAKADARKVAQTVQGLFREGTQGGPLPIVVSADERVNALVVSCGATDLKRIRDVVAKLDTDQTARVSEIRVIPLKYARAENLTQVLNTSLNSKIAPLSDLSPNAQSVLQFVTRTEDGQELVTAALKEAISITPDPRMNALVVSGPVDYMGLLEQIVGRLDNSSSREAKIRVFSLRNADAQQTAQLLLSMFRMQSSGTAAAANGQRTIQYTLMKPAADGTETPSATAVIGSEEQTALTVSVDPRTNTLLVGGTEHYVALVQQIIETLDSSEALERKTEVYRLKNAQAPDVGTAIRSFLDQERQRVTQVLGTDAVGTAQRLLEREVAIVPEQVSNTLLLSASPRYFEQIHQIIEELDQAQSQVLIQVLLAEVTLDSNRDLGFEWTFTKNVGNGWNVGTGTDFGVPTQMQNFGGYSALVTGNNMEFLMRALENDGRVEVLSRPQILTADNKIASINIGQRVPIITGSSTTPQGGQINTFDYRDVGVNLTVTPRITGEGFVKIDVGATNSSLASSSVEINDKATVPIINERRASTTVTVQSGQTVVIGGLIGTVDDIRRKKTPFLGDIPGVGFFFRSTSKKSERRELLIMLTPQVLTANHEQEPKITTIGNYSTRMLEKSTLRSAERKDPLKTQLMDSIFPNDINATKTNAPAGKK